MTGYRSQNITYGEEEEKGNMVLDSQSLFSNQQFIHCAIHKTRKHGVMIPPRANEATGCNMNLFIWEEPKLGGKDTKNVTQDRLRFDFHIRKI